MKRLSIAFGALLALYFPLLAAEPLRVFIRAGVKTHGPNQHDHPHFLKDWVPLLNERGLKADGSMEFPTAEQLDRTDVLIIFAADGMKIVGAERERFERFLQRGGGVVVLHDGVVSADQHEWCKGVIGGSWIWPKNAPEKKPTKWFEGNVGLCFVDEQHPITRGVSNFDWKDEVYNQLDMAPDARVLATSFVDVFNIWPQLWTYEKTREGGTKPYRAFVSIPGHEYDVFETPHYRAILLRGIAWAGGRENADEFVKPVELASLRYPAGGPTPAAQAVQRFNLHPEFDVTLVADENVAEKIMSLDWDPQGRLWVVETPEYPGGRDIHKSDAPAKPYRKLSPDKYPVGGKEPRQPQDRISVLEDTNGDGVMDKKTVFVDGLELPTSLVLYKDGVIVGQAPDIFWFRDTDGDGKSDKFEVLYTGWGTGDTHAVISNFRWGMDGWVYGSVGYSRGRVRSPKTGKEFGDIAAGIYRFRPDGSAIEQMAAGGCNTWGCEVAPDGELFFTTATCGEPICHIVLPEKAMARGSVGGIKSYKNIIEENKIYPAVPETRQPYVQIDWVGAWTAAAGACVYDGGAWPAKWAPDDRFSFFMSEATMHIFHHEFLDPAGSTYQGRKEESRRETEFMTSADYWFRPIHSRVGPDGAMYVVDFYNQIAVHNDTRGPAHGARNAASRPDRDHHFARVYRVQHKQAQSLPAWKLDRGDATGLVALLAHPNGWVRTTANRLLLETRADVAPQLTALAQTSPNRYGRVQALYALNNLGRLDDATLAAAARDQDAAVRKTAAHLGGERESASPEVQKALRALIDDRDGRVQMNALIALGTAPPSREIIDAVVARWPALDDKYLQSAALGVAVRDPGLAIDSMLAANQEGLDTLARHLTRLLAQKGDMEGAARVVTALGRAPASSDPLKQVALESLVANLKGSSTPAWSGDLQSALSSLLKSANPAVQGAALPLIAKWDASGALRGELKPMIESMEKQLADTTLSDEVRGQVAANLVGVRAMNDNIVPAVAKLLMAGNSTALQKRVVEALGGSGDAVAGRELLAAFPQLTGEVQDAAFGQIIKRVDWSRDLVKAVEAEKVNWRALGPSSVHRLRTHPDRGVAREASRVFEQLRGPEAKEKDKLIASLLPEVEKAGHADNGQKLFEQNCAACHIFKGKGRNLAPDLTGMGVHGAHELLLHVIDPNRVVEPNFVSVSIETKDGEIYDGVVVSENRASVKLRNASTDVEVRTADIRERRSTGRSLMPEGFEALGAEGLRDLLAYISAEEGRFRVIDLSSAFTADSTHGIYASKESTRESLVFRKFGLIKAGDVPFDVVHPSKTPRGNNLVVLKSRNGIARDNPRMVEIPVPNLKAGRLHILGNVGGWAWPFGGDSSIGLPVAKITVIHSDGAPESWTLTNGIHVVDYNNANAECPGTKKVEGIVSGGQVRLFSPRLRNKSPVTRITIESFNNTVAGTFIGITAELGEPTGPEYADAAAATGTATDASTAPRKFTWGEGIRVLSAGGGSSHEFARWFGRADTATLTAGGKVSMNYTENTADVQPALKDIDVLYLSTNQKFPGPESHTAILDFANAGKGLLLVHPAIWYNGWSASYHRDLVGGGSRGHDKLGEFEVTVENTSHPVTTGLPATFRITDELYNFIRDPQGAEMEVLATGKSPTSGKTFPVVWITKHPKARIVCITLGHDGRAHDLPAFKQLLQNATAWAAGKK
jgi:putative membrane-bound dehydrogenase-like protein